jgi:hypothetical protein
MLRRLALAIIPLALLCAPAPAQTTVAQVTLTTERVEAVITSFPAMRTRLQELGARYDDARGADGLAAEVQALIFAHGVSADLDAAAAESGFAGFADWWSTTYSVLIAHAFAAEPAMDTQMADALRQIDASPGLTEEQKAQMRAMIAASMGVIATVQPPQENIDAVLPYAAEIEVLLD